MKRTNKISDITRFHIYAAVRDTHTLPPSSLELTVTTTDPIVMSEMTREKTCMDCAFGA